MNSPDRPFRLLAATHQVLLSAVALIAIMGCSADKPDAQAIELGKTPYPDTAPYAEDLDIVARQKGGTLYLDNRAPIVLKNIQLWVNQQYIALLPAIEIGSESDGNTVDLKKMVNSFGERYPVGGFLTPDKTFPVVLVEVFDPATNKRHRLLTRPRTPL